MTDTDILPSLVRMALAEDIGPGDLTAAYFIPGHDNAVARVVAKEEGVFAGGEAAREVFAQADPAISISECVQEGTRLKVGDVALVAKGPARALLTAERTALNFLQRLSGVATLTRRYVDAVGDLSVKVLDTRKTTPGWRQLEKAAVRAGGGHNHRMGLYDRVMVKDNHLLRESAGETLEQSVVAFKRDHPSVKVEVEADTLDQVERFLGIDGVDVVLLDNMSLEQLREAVDLRSDRRDVELEASGGVSLETIRGIAETGVDSISVGALTHSAPSLDLSMTFGDRA